MGKRKFDAEFREGLYASWPRPGSRSRRSHGALSRCRGYERSVACWGLAGVLGRAAAARPVPPVTWSQRAKRVIISVRV